MSAPRDPDETDKDTGMYFPIEAKVAAGVIALGAVAAILKAFGLF